jgi:hypothetical protein
MPTRSKGPYVRHLGACTEHVCDSSPPLTSISRDASLKARFARVMAGKSAALFSATRVTPKRRTAPPMKTIHIFPLSTVCFGSGRAICVTICGDTTCTAHAPTVTGRFLRSSLVASVTQNAMQRPGGSHQPVSVPAYPPPLAKESATANPRQECRRGSCVQPYSHWTSWSELQRIRDVA